MRDRIDIRILRTREELAALMPQWGALWRHDPHATPFQSPEWLLPWTRQFARRDLRSAAIYRDNRLIGLLPFYIHTELRRRERHLLLLGAGTSDYLDGIFAPACTPELIRNAFYHLCSEQDWDVAYLTQLRSDSRLLDALRDSRDLQAARADSESCARMPAVRINELPGKIRQNARYYRNRAERAGALDFHTAGMSDCLAAFEVLRKLHTERWQQAGQPGVLADPRVLAWHREALPQLVHAGTLRLYTLTLNGEPIASAYALIDPPAHPDRTLYIYLPAFSIRHADLRPGTVLLAQVIDQAAQEGVRTVDFLRGDEPYKRHWHAEKSVTHGLSLRAAVSALRRAA